MGHHLATVRGGERREREHDVGPVDRLAGAVGARRPADARRLAPPVDERVGALGVAVEDGDLDPGQRRGRGPAGGAGLDARADDRRPQRPGPAAGANRRDRDAADRRGPLGGDRAAVEDRDRHRRCPGR